MLKNKLSHLRVHMTVVEAPANSLSHPCVLRAIDSFERNKEYVPRVKDPISPSVFREILLFLDHQYISNILCASMLCLYYGALHQSELLPLSVKSWDPSKFPQRKDARIPDNECHIFVKFGDNLQRVGQYSIVLAQAPDSCLCPVSAISHVLADSLLQSDLDPVFVFQDTHLPVPASFVARHFHNILCQLGHAHLSCKLSLHSLRKAAATNAFDSGFPELYIKCYRGSLPMLTVLIYQRKTLASSYYITSIAHIFTYSLAFLADFQLSVQHLLQSRTLIYSIISGHLNYFIS